MRIKKILTWLLLLLLLVLQVSGQCLDDQRSLLLQLKNTLSLAQTSSSTKLATWARSPDCCDWAGVGCDRSGHVTALALDGESITGGLESSSALFGLRNLQRLNLARNSFNSSTQIPKGLQNLTGLSYLNLSNAGFGGQIPLEISSLTNLATLDLSSAFQGISPLRLENPNLSSLVWNLTSLRELYLDGVNISSQANDWSRAVSLSPPELTNLSLRGCGLSGPMDRSLSRLRSLSVLRIDNNNLSTSVPDFFADFANLTSLSLSFCSLNGTFPSKIFQLPTLQNLDLTNNPLLGGTVPEFMQRGSFRTMSLSYTNFSGSLPDSISNLGVLSEINLSNCKFTGRVPPSLGELTELTRLDLSVNSFTGPVPAFAGSKKLAYVDLSRNFLSGSLASSHFQGLSGLGRIDLGHNSIGGLIPGSLFGLPLLQKLTLSNNDFIGPVEVDPGDAGSSSLDTIDLSSNRLGGPIPEPFFRLKRLNVLVLSYNDFDGVVPLEKFHTLSNLTRLELAHNKLSVDVNGNHSRLSQFLQLSRLSLASCDISGFPDLNNQSRLTFLDLSNNHLTGEIPSWIWGIGDGQLLHLNLSLNLLEDLERPYAIPSSLSVLDLHSNRLRGELPLPPSSAIYLDYSSNDFSGSIPQNIGELAAFAILFSLSNNSLSGPIPESLCNASYLQVLDLSSNGLNGTIPPCILENNDSLGVLNLGKNRLAGDIPDAFSANCGLKTLDLSRNGLSGKMPPSLANCRSLEVLNVGNNRIGGTFPYMLTSSSSLSVLVLRNNRFSGDIACRGFDNGTWLNLQIVDIASNGFTGSLNPKCVESWRGMAKDDGALHQQRHNNHLGYEFTKFNNFYYQDAVTVTMKGLELELVKILTVFASIDLSSNNFHGVIPEAIGGLSSLYVLNLSHNALTGTIPGSIGNLTELESLDLSSNRLTGEIPQQLTGLYFLSFLNLSYNELQGTIPKGNQFGTFHATSFEGNAGLCGAPLNSTCGSEAAPSSDEAFVRRRSELNVQMVIVGLGYGIGAALILAPTLLCRQWRERCDECADRFLKTVFPGYGFSYVRCYGKVEAVEKVEDCSSDDDDDDDEDDDEDDDDVMDKLSRGRYCVFCTKLDNQMKKAIHSTKCTCHYSAIVFPASISSSDSLLVIYQ